jgi:serine protease
MKRTPIIAALSLFSLALAAGSEVASAAVQKASRPIAGEYIAVLRPGVARAADAGPADGPGLRDVASDMMFKNGGGLRRVYGAAISGFAFKGSAAAAEALSRDPRVAYVAEDGWMLLAGTQATPPSWGLDRIDQRSLPLDTAFNYANDGAGVDIYIVDTGIKSSHVDFGGRVDLANSVSLIADGYATEDCHGHGTFVAAVAAGSTFGVAKGARLHSVRVANCQGAASISNIMAGIDWITARYPTSTKGKRAPSARNAVVNISLTVGASQALDDAVAKSILNGISYVVAAGNNGGDACLNSPGRVAGAITVGATDSADVRWAYSNFGSCVDMFAPGVAITSAYIRSNTDSLWMTGTSAAAPHVAGAAALYLADNPGSTPAQVSEALASGATTGLLQNAGAGSPDRLVYAASSTDTGTDNPPVASFTFACKSRRCSFNASGSSDDKGIASYVWDFGDGHTGNGVRVSERFPSSGLIFPVTLYVTDTLGQTTTVQRDVRF